MKQHFNVLDSFRGICACIVAMSHFTANSINYASPLLDRGSIYVDFFFVLSGFVIFANYKDLLRTGYSLGKFVWLRFGRLYPLHFAVLMAFILVDVFQIFVKFDGAALYQPFSAPGETPEAIIANLLLVHSMHTIDTLAFNGPSWSISVEFFAYILFGLILSYSGKYFAWIIGAVGLGSAALLFASHGELYAKLDYGFLRCVYGFACGALSWLAYEKVRSHVPAILSRARSASIIETVTFVGAAVYISLFSFGVSSFLAPLVFALTVIVFAFESGKISQFLKGRFFLLLGTLSYSIYMTHMFIAGKFFALPIRLLENRLGWEISVPRGDVTLYGTDIVIGTLLEIVFLATVIGCSYISYKIIEEPFRDWSKKLARSGIGSRANHSSQA